MRKIQLKEHLIITLMNQGNGIALAAFNKLYERLEDDDIVKHTHYIPLLVDVYLSNTELEVWQLAVKHNISESTVYRYRHDFIAWFRHYYRKLNQSNAIRMPTVA
jgi:hypothetical protein